MNDDFKKPLYNLGLPFDNIKIIFNTLMGDPRYTFKPLKDSTNIFVASNQFDKGVFGVNIDSLNVAFDQLYAEHVIAADSIDEFKEYGKLFHNFGSALLTAIANTLVKKGPFNEHRIVLNKLGIAFSRNIFSFQKLINGPEYDTTNDNTKDYYMTQIIENIDDMINKSINNTYIELYDYLTMTYISLTIYLSGILINLCEKYNITFESIYSDGASYVIDTFADRLINAPENENESIKYKLISLFYTYYLITNFFNKNLGIEFTTKMNEPFVKIGEKISKLDYKFIEKELDITHLTQSDLGRKYATCTMLALLSDICIFKEYNQFDASLMDYELNDTATIAQAIIPLYSNYFGLKFTYFDSYLDDNNVTNGDLDLFYNHFIDTVVNTLPHSISPKYFFKVTVYAAGFRKMKDKKSGAIKEKMALGLYQAEAVMMYLYREWFMAHKSYRISKGISPSSDTYIKQKHRAMIYITSTLLLYTHNTIDMPDSTNYFDIAPLHSLIALSDINESDILNKIINVCSSVIYNTSSLGEREHRIELIIDKLNKGTIPLPSAYIFIEDKDTSLSSFNYIHETLETDYATITMDLLSEYSNTPDTDENMMTHCKLGSLVANNIADILKKEKTDERSEKFMNVFIKCIIPLYMTDMKYDKSKSNDDDLFNETNEESDWILPKLKSNNMFNFLNK